MANAERFCCLTKASTIGCGNRRTEMMQVNIFCPSNWHMLRASPQLLDIIPPMMESLPY